MFIQIFKFFKQFKNDLKAVVSLELALIAMPALLMSIFAYDLYSIRTVEKRITSSSALVAQNIARSSFDATEINDLASNVMTVNNIDTAAYRIDWDISRAGGSVASSGIGGLSAGGFSRCSHANTAMAGNPDFGDYNDLISLRICYQTDRQFDPMLFEMGADTVKCDRKCFYAYSNIEENYTDILGVSRAVPDEAPAPSFELIDSFNTLSFSVTTPILDTLILTISGLVPFPCRYIVSVPRYGPCLTPGNSNGDFNHPCNNDRFNYVDGSTRYRSTAPVAGSEIKYDDDSNGSIHYCYGGSSNLWDRFVIPNASYHDANNEYENRFVEVLNQCNSSNDDNQSFSASDHRVPTSWPGWPIWETYKETTRAPEFNHTRVCTANPSPPGGYSCTIYYNNTAILSTPACQGLNYCNPVRSYRGDYRHGCRLLSDTYSWRPSGNCSEYRLTTTESISGCGASLPGLTVPDQCTYQFETTNPVSSCDLNGNSASSDNIISADITTSVPSGLFDTHGLNLDGALALFSSTTDQRESNIINALPSPLNIHMNDLNDYLETQGYTGFDHDDVLDTTPYTTPP